MTALEVRVKALEVQLSAFDRLTEAHQRAALQAVELSESKSAGSLSALRWMIYTMAAIMLGVGTLLANVLLKVPR